jgi:nitrogen-specific signal transduction histidine kinase
MGSGLGIKNIIENYKGTITLKQNMEKEQFTVSLPIINS